MKYTADFVRKVNEVYHDVEGREYENKHAEIFVDESDRWLKIGHRFIANKSEKTTLLDLGTGTGFVPLKIGEILKEGDLCVCSDVSANMLDISRENLSNKGFKCEFIYLKLDGKEIDFESNYFSHITLNSVLHHIPDFSTIFKEIDRLLQIHGRLIIVHEPNRAYYTNKFLQTNSKLFYVFMNPRLYLAIKLRMFGFSKASSRVCKDRHVSTMNKFAIAEEVNRQLLDEGIIKDPLSVQEIGKIVDFHLHISGEVHGVRGISISELLQEYLPNYEIEHFETYNHLVTTGSQNKFTKMYDSFLKRLFPEKGAHFSVVLKKVAHS
jgi:ubiquinone/menaquinone biosynthesis C-methylase UbiE